LLAPGGHDVPGADGEDDPLVRRCIRVAPATVPADHVDLGVAEPDGGEVRPRARRQIPVDLQRDDLSRVTDNLGHEGGIVAGARADLEDAVARLEAQLLQHDRHDRRLG
jgi:hypothetical protein